MRAEVVKAVIKAMLNCEERDDYRSMRVHIKWHAKDIIEHGDIQTLRDLSALLVRIATASDVENREGAGSLLKQDHPDHPDHPDHVAWSQGRWIPLILAGSDCTPLSQE